MENKFGIFTFQKDSKQVPNDQSTALLTTKNAAVRNMFLLVKTEVI